MKGGRTEGEGMGRDGGESEEGIGGNGSWEGKGGGDQGGRTRSVERRREK